MSPGSAEILESRLLLASQLISSDAPSHELSPGQTIDVPVIYQTLNDDGVSSALQTDLISFNLHYDADELTFVETRSVFSEGLHTSPVSPRAENDVSVIGDDNDARTETVLLARFTDSDSGQNPGWPNVPRASGTQLYIARFMAKPGFSGSTIRFSVNEAGTVPGTIDEYTFLSNSLGLQLPSEPTLTIADAADTSEGQDQTFLVTLTPAAASIVTVNYSTEDGDGPSGATAGEDFEARLNQTLTFNPGETQKFISIPLIDDSIIDPDETYDVKLSNVSGARLGKFSATGMIIDGDGGSPRISISDAADVTEGETATFTISLSAAATAPVTVRYSTTDGDGPTGARNGVDLLQQTNQQVTFSVGETEKTITVETIDDSIAEDPEDFGVTLSNPAGATLFRASGTGLINDNDSGGPILRVLDAAAVTEGADAVFTVTLSPAAAQTVTVIYATASGSGPTGAINGQDYTALLGQTLTFDAGETQKTITVTTTDDTAEETTEEFQLNLSNANGAAIDRAQAVGTINDNDSVPLRSGDVDGDNDFDANDSFLIKLVKLFATDAQLNQSKGASTLTAVEIRSKTNQLDVAGDVDGDQDFDANDAFLIHLVQLFATNNQLDQSKGASTLSASQIRANVTALGAAANSGEQFTKSPTSVELPVVAVSESRETSLLAASTSARRSSPDLFSVATDHSARQVLTATPADRSSVEPFEDSFRSWIDVL